MEVLVQVKLELLGPRVLARHTVAQLLQIVITIVVVTEVILTLLDL